MTKGAVHVDPYTCHKITVTQVSLVFMQLPVMGAVSEVVVL